MRSWRWTGLLAGGLLAACLFAVCLVCGGAPGSKLAVPLFSLEQQAQTQQGESGGDAAGASTLNSESPDADDATETLEWKNGAPYRAAQVMVRLAEGTSARDLSNQLASFDFVKTPDVSDDDLALGWVKLDLTQGTDVAQAIEQLQTADAVAGAQPNFVYHAMEGDAASTTASAAAGHASPAISSLVATSLQTYGTNDPESKESWPLGVIGAYSAWNIRKVDHAVTVAIIDSGCDVAHPDLAANVVDAYNVLDGSKAVPDATNHGTHVAGIVAAVPNNGIGVAGVSYNAGIMPIKVMEKSTTDTASLVKAYDYIIANAATYNVRVVNVSLGAEQSGLDADDKALMRAIDQAYYANILSVFAAGNDDGTIPYYCFPCDFVENGVGVINLTENYAETGKPSSSSNYNRPGEKTKDLSAPGTRINSTVSGGGYQLMSGTSMATPVVSGVAALVFAQNLSLGAGEAKSVLCTAADDIVTTSGSGKGFDDYTGYGLVRADHAVTGSSNAFIKGGDGLAIGGTLSLSVPQAGAWTWSSSNPGIASVNAATGLVTGVAHGEAVISAQRGSTTLRRTVVVYDARVSGKSKVKAGQSITLVGWSNPVGAWTYRSSDPKIATVGQTSGVVRGKKTGTVTITAQLTACPAVQINSQIKVLKGQNPMVVKTKTKKVSYSKVKKKSRSVKGGIVFASAPAGKVTYTKVKKGSSKRLSINKKTGKITVKKGTKRGTYKIKVKVKAKGNASYNSATKTVTVKVKVK